MTTLKHRRPKLITWTRTWLLLASGVVLQTVIYKGLYGIDRFFLKEIKNVMFLNKIDVPYCLVVFFVVCPRLRPFWSVFGELALFWCPTANSGTVKVDFFKVVIFNENENNVVMASDFWVIVWHFYRLCGSFLMYGTIVCVSLSGNIDILSSKIRCWVGAA